MFPSQGPGSNNFWVHFLPPINVPAPGVVDVTEIPNNRQTGSLPVSKSKYCIDITILLLAGYNIVTKTLLCSH